MAIKELLEINTADIVEATELLKVLGDREGQFVWKQLTAEGGDFVAFVTADDENSYPDGGTQDGYWYELVAEGANIAELFGFTEMAVDRFTLSADKILKDAPQAHSLGKQPKAALIFANFYEEITTGSRAYLRFAFGVAPSRIISPVDAQSGIQGFNFYHTKLSSSNRLDCDEDSMINALTTGYVKFKEKDETLSPTIYFQAGVEHTMYTLA